jgi:hypothetical protein
MAASDHMLATDSVIQEGVAQDGIAEAQRYVDEVLAQL